MVKHTKIEWAHHTFNPWIGCTKVSPACDHCYAEVVAQRMAVTWGPGQSRKLTKPRNWLQPLAWDKEAIQNNTRYRVFCASLADVFDNEVPIDWKVRLFDLIRSTPNLDWLLLTKRVGIVKSQIREIVDYLHHRTHLYTETRHWLQEWENGRPPSNVWLGATVVNQTEADRDVPKLLAVPAKVRFLSIEPMLGPVNLEGHTSLIAPGLAEGKDWLTGYTAQGSSIFGGSPYDAFIRSDLELPEDYMEPRIHWVIAGGESGDHARPSNPTWFTSLRDQCAEAGVPFLFKQWGEWVPETHPKAEPEGQTTDDGFVYPSYDDSGRPVDYQGVYMCRVGKLVAGRELDGQTHDGVPE